MTPDKHKTIDTHSGSPITSIVLNPFQNEKLYGFVSFNTTVQFYNFQTSELVFQYQSQFHKTINSMAFFPNESKFVTCSNFIEFFDIKQNTPYKWIKPNTLTNAKLEDYDINKINDIAVISDDVISTCDEQRQLCLYDLRQSTFKPTQTFIDAQDSLTTMSYNNNNNNNNNSRYTIHTGSSDGKLYSYDLRKGLLTMLEMDQVITRISGQDDCLLINKLSANPVLFDIVTEEIKEIKRPDIDQEYRSGNCFHGSNGYITCSELGKVYYHTEQELLIPKEFDLQKSGKARVLGCCDSVGSTVAVGDGEGRIDLFSTD